MSRASTLYEPVQIKNQGSTPSNPTTSYVKLYAESDVLKYRNSSGTVVSLVNADPTSAAHYYATGDGSASAVAFGFTSATSGQNGMYRDGTDLAFSVANSKKLNIGTTKTTITGDLQVDGTVTYINTEVLKVKDNLIVSNCGPDYIDGGFAMRRSNAGVATDTAVRTAVLPDQTGASTTQVILDTGASAVDDAYKNMLIYVDTSGGQYRIVTGYVGSTKVATVDVAWAGQPVQNDNYSVYNQVYASAVFHEASKQLQYLYLAGEASSTFTGAYVDGRMGKLQLADGAVSGPGLSFATDATTGLYYSSSGVHLAIGGSDKFSVDSTTTTVGGNLSVTGVESVSAGTAALPSLYFSTNNTTGLYQIAANQVGVSVSTNKILDVSASGLIVTKNFSIQPAGYETEPMFQSYADASPANPLFSRGDAFVYGRNFVVNNRDAPYDSAGIALRRDPDYMQNDTAYETGSTAQAGSTSTTIVLRAASSGTNDAYKGYLVKITGGTGSGQVRVISSYVGSTKVATVTSSWSTTPDDTSVYNLYNKQYASFMYMPGMTPTDPDTEAIHIGYNEWPSDTIAKYANIYLGKIFAKGDLAIRDSSNVTKFTVANATGNTSITGTLAVGSTITASGKLCLSEGTAALPSAFFAANNTSGIYQVAANNLGVSIGAVKVMGISSSSVVFTGEDIYINSSGDALTNFSVANATGNTSIAGTLTVGGTITASGLVYLANGSAAAPELAFTADTDTGMYRPGTNELAFAVGGKDALKLSSSVVRQCESASGFVCDYIYVRQGSVAAVAEPAAVSLATITIPDGGKCTVDIDAYEVDANNAYEALSTVHVVYASGTTVTDNPVFSRVEDTTWTLVTGSNTLTLKLLPNDSDTNNYTKYYNVKVRLQPMNNTACTVADA